MSVGKLDQALGKLADILNIDYLVDQQISGNWWVGGIISKSASSVKFRCCRAANSAQTIILRVSAVVF